MNGILHEEIRMDRKKIGFNTSLKSITNFNGNVLYEFLNESYALKNIIDLKKIKKLNLDGEISNDINKFLFSLINLKIFFQIHKQ